ncbi:metallophosphoesterase [Novosphingobium sp. FSY-8]|uniref:Metallophosphoesterase n=1 Tax=Novosphingobium ovatum TaxID=1908523 RepID=A0ABW9XHG9_9SPHN|nr:metallophosphoesterase [Novosphingobium ovatum]
MTTLFHISDLHFGAEDRAALRWFMQCVADVRPTAVVCTGDLTMRGTTREFAAAEEWLRGLDVPVHVEPGNHDMPYYWEMVERLRRPFDRYRAMRARVQGDVPGGRVRLVSLPTVTPAQWRLNWSKGHVRRSALAGALADLARADHAQLRLVACHHPLIHARRDGAGSTTRGWHAVVQLAQAGADVVLSGHVHDPFDRMVQVGGRSIRMVGAGTLSERLRKTPPGFNRLDWSLNEGLRVTPQVMG